jgi:DNA helicase-2/ATP-dependent DNA helicase PcrA
MSPDGPTLTGPDAVLASLDPEQRAVALASRGPVCVLAGAGTGKTRAVVHRIAYAVATGVVDPARVLAVTFTTRAAGELRGRLRQLGAVAVPGTGMDRVQALTFHAAALRQLNHFWPSIVGGQPPHLHRISYKAAPYSLLLFTLLLRFFPPSPHTI